MRGRLEAADKALSRFRPACTMPAYLARPARPQLLGVPGVIGYAVVSVLYPFRLCLFRLCLLCLCSCRLCPRVFPRVCLWRFISIGPFVCANARSVI